MLEKMLGMMDPKGLAELAMRLIGTPEGMQGLRHGLRDAVPTLTPKTRSQLREVATLLLTEIDRAEKIAATAAEAPRQATPQSAVRLIDAAP